MGANESCANCPKNRKAGSVASRASFDDDSTTTTAAVYKGHTAHCLIYHHGSMLCPTHPVALLMPLEHQHCTRPDLRPSHHLKSAQKTPLLQSQ
jgi:hypothetical protein